MQHVLVHSWSQLHRPIKAWRNDLTIDDLDTINGTYDTLISLLEKKYGYAALIPPKQVQQRRMEYEREHWLRTSAATK